MPILTPFIVLPLLLAPAPADRSTTLSEVEASAPAPAAAASPAAAPAEPDVPDPQSSDPAAPPDPTGPQVVTLDRTPMPVLPPERIRPDRPIRWRVDIVADVGGTRIGDRAWRAFDDDRIVLTSGVTLRADARLGGGRVFLGGGASFRTFARGSTLYETTSTSARVREPLLFARLAVATVEGVDVFLHAGGGPSIVDLDLYSTQSASQRAVVAMADGQGGVAIYLPKRWLARRGASRATGGIELAAGYTWRGSIDVRPQLATVTDPIPTTGAPLGDLSLRGVVWRFGLFLRFQ